MYWLFSSDFREIDFTKKSVFYHVCWVLFSGGWWWRCSEAAEEVILSWFVVRFTEAKITVTSSSLPPITFQNPLALAFLANGDKNVSSCDNFRAINAMELATAWKKIYSNYYLLFLKKNLTFKLKNS